MTLEFDIRIAAKDAPEIILERLLKSVNLDVVIQNTSQENMNSVYKAVCPSFVAYAHDVRGDKQPVLKLGIAATVCIALITHGQQSIATDLVATRMCLSWLEWTEDDLAFLFEGEIVHLYRKDNRIIVNSADDVWIPEHLALVKLPYTTEKIGVL